jgi:putative membrane protein
MNGMKSGPGYRAVLLAILACYACARVLQVITGPTPWLGLVALDVLSAVAFALVDGVQHHGWRGAFVFAGICVAVGNAVENISIATGFPFGHYRFLEVMGPRILNVPILLGLAYIGMACVSWTVARILLSRTSGRHGILALPAVASLIMVSWDVAQDPVWSTFLHAWIWRDGGSWFGVPLSNFVGWYATAFTIFLLFAIYVRRRPTEKRDSAKALWPAVAFYALCAAGNVLQIWVSQPTPVMSDATGRQWQVAQILRASALVSVFLMGTFVVLAAGRLRARSTD